MKWFSCLAIILFAMASFAFAGANGSQKSQPAALKFMPPAISFTIIESFDVVIPVDIPCAGEAVTLEGKLHTVFHITLSGNQVVVKSSAHPQGISGSGELSGDKYQATGITQSTESGSLVNGQFSFSSINNFRIIGEKTGNNFLVHSNLHVTINADGTVTTLYENFSADCK